MPISWQNMTAARRGVRWYTNGLVSNPAAGTVLADTGAVSEDSEYHAYIVGSSTANARVRIEHRNPDNTANSQSPIVLHVGANTPIELFVPVRLVKGERLRVVMDAALTGDVVFSVLWLKAFQE